MIVTVGESQWLRPRGLSEEISLSSLVTILCHMDPEKFEMSQTFA